jgi:hypothetical protein
MLYEPLNYNKYYKNHKILISLFAALKLILNKTTNPFQIIRLLIRPEIGKVNIHFAFECQLPTGSVQNKAGMWIVDMFYSL